MYEIKIGQVMKRLLLAQRKSLKEVSRDTGIPYSTLHTWLENRQPKDILKTQALADYLGISLHQLLFDQLDSRDEKPRDQIPHIGNDLIQGVFEIIVRKIK